MTSNKEGEKIKAILLLEIVGKPAEHLTTTLKDLLSQMEQEKGVNVIMKKIEEPVEIEKQKGFYSSFAEVEVDVDEILYLAVLMFKYMPSHIEVVSPESISLSNSGWSDILSELVRKLHSYDEIARVLGIEKKILENKLREVLGKKNKEETISDETESESDEE
ncbi:MAG: hypothetical protein WD876_01960 [Candidatus Pacearchaeota archaeon]